MINQTDLVALMNEVQTEYEKIKKAEPEASEAKKEMKPDPEKKDEEGPMAEDSDPKAPMKKEVMEKEYEPEEVIEEVEEVEDKDRDQLCAEYLAMDDDKLISHYVAMNHALAIKMQHEAHEEEEEELAEETVMADPMMKKVNMGMKKFSMGMKKKTMKKTGKMMMKSEMSIKEVDMQKQIQELEGKIGSLTKSLEKLATVPQVKAISGDTFLAKSEVAPANLLTKAEVVAKLREKARDPKLSFSDRAKITQYTYNVGSEAEIKKFLEI